MIRKIMTAEEKEKRDTRMKRIIGILLGLIMLLSSIGYAFMSFEGDSGNTSKIKYNGITFTKGDSGTWKFTYGNANYETFYQPGETTNIGVKTSKTLGSYYNSALYFGINNLSEIASNGNTEIVKNLGTTIMKSQLACLSESCARENNYPIKDCNTDNIIIFKESSTNSSRVTENGKCVLIEYASGQEQKAADAFLFKLIGIN